jgi:hypothetical protein
MWWRDLLDGRRGRAETHELVRPWVEETPEALDDPITSMGVQHLYGFGPGADDRDGADHHRGPEAAARLAHWLSHGERFDADPDGWHRDRIIQSVHAIRREQGHGRAQALASQLVARGELSSEDVTRILGTTA